jgi:glycosyltransferase involved in cell wall biosynthesis
MKVIIQIPCFNEEASLPVTLSALPRELNGVDTVEWLIIDDGSHDKTAEVARSLGADHVIRLKKNGGLAKAFSTGLDACLDRGADIIVNTDADNQYHAGDIQLLVNPILEGRADVVLGARPINSIPHFSGLKKILQKIGSAVVRSVSGTSVPDAPSGFRAMSREAASQLHVFSRYTYTLETIIQAGQQGLVIQTVPVRVNADLRPSRLLKSNFDYIIRSIGTIVRVFVLYRPFRFFSTIAIAFSAVGVILGLRFLLAFAMGNPGGKVQSLILAAILIVLGGQFFALALLAEAISVNRRLLESIRIDLRKSQTTFKGSGHSNDKE